MAEILPPINHEFDGAEEIFNLIKAIATTLDPTISGSVASVITPAIVQAIKSAQADSQVPVDIQDALRSNLLANATLLAVEQSQIKSEGFWVDLVKDLTGPFRGAADLPKHTYKGATSAIGVAGDAADKLVNDVAREITRGLILCAQLVGNSQGQAESTMETETTPASKNEVAFVEQLAKALPSHPHKKAVGGFLENTATSIGSFYGKAYTERPDLIDYISKHCPKALLPFSRPGSAFDSSNPEGFFTDLLTLGVPAFEPIKHLNGKVTDNAESAFDDNNAEGFFNDIANTIKKVSQAFILQNIMADQYLTAQMARPVTELKEEGFFDDVGDCFKQGKNVEAVGLSVAATVGPAIFIPVVGPILGGGLLIGGYATAIAGRQMQ